MKSLILTAYNRLEYADVPEPQLAPDEVLVRVRACGICGSDVHGVTGSTGRRIPPIIMGHEAAGEVVDAGADAGDWPAGTRVAFGCAIHCGACWFCGRGLTNLCARRQLLGVSLPGNRRHGAYADYCAVPARGLHRIPAGLDYAQACLMEPLSVTVHALSRIPLAPDEAALVIGTGFIGLLAVQLLRRAGGNPIIAVDRNRWKLALAHQLGATHSIVADAAHVPAFVLRHTGGRGADLAVDAAGHDATFNLAIASTRKGGAICQVGNFAPAVTLPLQTLVMSELTLYGSATALHADEVQALALLADGEVLTGPLVNAVAPLAEGIGWFERLAAGERGLMKVILAP